MRKISPSSSSKTFRRELRRDIRNLLGPSSDAAPYGLSVFRVLPKVDMLLQAATGERYSIVVQRKLNGEITNLRPTQALAEAREVGCDPDW